MIRQYLAEKQIFEHLESECTKKKIIMRKLPLNLCIIPKFLLIMFANEQSRCSQSCGSVESDPLPVSVRHSDRV